MRGIETDRQKERNSSMYSNVNKKNLLLRCFSFQWLQTTFMGWHCVHHLLITYPNSLPSVTSHAFKIEAMCSCPSDPRLPLNSDIRRCLLPNEQQATMRPLLHSLLVTYRRKWLRACVTQPGTVLKCPSTSSWRQRGSDPIHIMFEHDQTWKDFHMKLFMHEARQIAGRKSHFRVRGSLKCIHLGDEHRS